MTYQERGNHCLRDFGAITTWEFIEIGVGLDIPGLACWSSFIFSIEYVISTHGRGLSISMRDRGLLKY